MNRLNNSNIFFKLFADKDELTLDEIYAVAQRSVQNQKKKRNWIGNKLSYWRTRGLAEATYGSTGSLTGVKLSDHGRTLLGKPTKRNEQTKITIEIIEQILERMRREHPDFEITFTIRSKQGNLSLEL